MLTRSEGQREGRLLYETGNVWVHKIRRENEPFEIASIVACTRNCNKVATITKVYTNPRWRRLGCAERLVRMVCKQYVILLPVSRWSVLTLSFHRLLYSAEPKEKIALFVGNDNPASKVYNRVGFLGLDKTKGPVEGCDRWLEIGFDRRRTEQGHW